MSYTNEAHLIPNYDVAGAIDLPYLSYGNNRVDYTGSIYSVFFDKIVGEGGGVDPANVPKIMPGKTAFYIRYMNKNNSRVFTEVLGVIDVINEYRLDPTTGDCKLSFKFIEVPINTYDPNMVVINPIISHILVDHDYIALIFEGDSDHVVEYVNKRYKTFVHAGVVYWLHDTLQMSMHIRPGEASIDTERPTLAIVAVASTLKVANSENHDEFTKILNQYLNNIYGQ